MENKITAVSCTIKAPWANIKTPDGKEIGVMLDKAPKLKAQIEAAIAKNVFPCELEGRVVVKGDKTYAWDVDEKKGGGGFKGAPRDEEAIVAQSCISSACTLYAQSSNAGNTQAVLATAEQFYNFVKSKSKKMQGNG